MTNQAAGKIRAKRAKRLVKEAIVETGKAEVWPVSLWIEEKFLQDLARRKKSSHPCHSSIYARMEMLGLCTSGDIARLIREVMVGY